jgi:DNA-binding transcriptional regulator GbsR (MarR family)
MEIDQTEKTMTVKEIADALKVSTATISRAAKKLFPAIIKNGVKARFTKDQAYSIAADATPLQALQQSAKVAKVAEVDYEQLAITIAKAVVIALRETAVPAQAQKQIAAPIISDRDTYRRAINKASHRTGIGQKELYGMVANELYYRCHVNIRIKAKNSGLSMIDVIENSGLLSDAISIANEM